MGQYWILLDMDARRKEWLGKLGESFFGMNDELCKILCRVPIPAFTLHPQEKPEFELCNGAGKNSALMRLPAELMGLVFGFLADDGDVIDMLWLAMTCRQCSRVGEAFVRRGLFEQYSASADHRLICVGDYLEQDDLPPNIELYEDEAEELEGSVDDEDGEQCDATLYQLQCKEGFQDDIDIHTKLRSKLPHDDWLLPTVHYLSTSRILRRLVPKAPCHCGCDVPLVLRNLSRNEYVRSQAMLDLHKTVTPANPADWLPYLGDAVMARICWASSPETSLNYEGPIQVHRGVWAGDRFDIVPEEFFEKERQAAEQPWTDVSVEVASEVEAIWVAEEYLERNALPTDGTPSTATNPESVTECA
ncbi:hypothetical protein BD626DRAFT_628409 [Schizophyllum amplum]|uniref:Uncharacterized protein n=1 Tax=Schizophyllum amplum TaxID=97359 RepID=A0A550CK35_9AGAR|nr:hypothetical protein BD626DRAFT_628409 [Auriculariopsis ampla]